LFTEKSDLEQKLWRYNDAIRTIYLAIKYYPGAKILQEALWMVYWVAWETNLAIGIYNQLISKDPENTLIYKKNIIYLNIMANNVDKASSAYMDFIKQWWKQDLEVTNQIRSMRWLGPLNELKEINN
jgi:tetratricopeptide (TPR) repeat protein